MQTQTSNGKPISCARLRGTAANTVTILRKADSPSTLTASVSQECGVGRAQKTVGVGDEGR